MVEVMKWLILKARGLTRILSQTGMCRSNGSLFNKKSLNMGPVFYQNILKHGSNFLTAQIFGFSHAWRKPRKSQNL